MNSVNSAVVELVFFPTLEASFQCFVLGTLLDNDDDDTDDDDTLTRSSFEIVLLLYGVETTALENNGLSAATLEWNAVVSDFSFSPLVLNCFLIDGPLRRAEKLCSSDAAPSMAWRWSFASVSP